MASISVQTFDGTGALDANWTVDNGSIARVSDKAESINLSESNEAHYSGTQMDSADHWVQATIGGKSDSNHGGVQFRRHATSGTRTFYQFEFQETDLWKVGKRVGGSWTDLDGPVNVGDSNNGPCVAKASIVGWTLSCYCDGTIISGLDLGGDTAIDGSGGNYLGIGAYSNSGGRFDDFSGGDNVEPFPFRRINTLLRM